jgi:hypothetical protein
MPLVTKGLFISALDSLAVKKSTCLDLEHCRVPKDYTTTTTITTTAAAAAATTTTTTTTTTTITAH